MSVLLNKAPAEAVLYDEPGGKKILRIYIFFLATMMALQGQ